MLFAIWIFNFKLCCRSYHVSVVCLGLAARARRGLGALIVIIVAHAVLLVLIELAELGRVFAVRSRVALLALVADRAWIGRIAVCWQILVALHLFHIRHTAVWLQVLFAFTCATCENNFTTFSKFIKITNIFRCSFK